MRNLASDLPMLTLCAILRTGEENGKEQSGRKTAADTGRADRRANALSNAKRRMDKVHGKGATPYGKDTVC